MSNQPVAISTDLKDIINKKNSHYPIDYVIEISEKYAAQLNVEQNSEGNELEFARLHFFFSA